MTTKPYTLFQATDNDTQAIVTLLKESFRAAYPDRYQPADIEEYFDLNYTEAKVDSWLSTPITSVWLAKREHDLEGVFVFHDKPSLLEPDTPAFEIDKLYLMPSAHGTGLAATFLKKLEETNRDMKLHWLLVAQKNIRAQRFYAKHNFKIMADGPSLIVGQEHAASFVMHRELG
ncbi:GNAT family N-acetyltransferase [Kordiimonas sp. SCSIO 12603]|uniref:GNAT family N-acetyltransferase n=1 Tax=Kordiimonas sp. SCSIO 12603 TaxID=2829596 RepID=UPI00210639FD|nr:GNAT family N-acetyltransferase [Kordiimonas sp. SCSIO 12603]UTW58624.1 GNAT family N-acetyltransferase [Kordiimonas sp. SCSIO 12603]